MSDARKTLVVGLYGGPGTGKSTMAARIFAELKERGFLTELAMEYAKDLVWQESHRVMLNQVYIFGKQHHRLWRLNGKVDVIVTDAPLLISLVYGETSDEFKTFVRAEIHKFNWLNIFLHRSHGYETEGRLQTEHEAVKMDAIILQALSNNFREAYVHYPDAPIEDIVAIISEKLSELQSS